MNFLLYLSNFIIPFVVVFILGYAWLKKVSIYDVFVKGAKNGCWVVAGILPTLIGLMMAVGVLRASGALKIFSDWLSPIMKTVKFPSELVPLVFTKIFSSSAATGFLIDIYKEYGTDSYLGVLASLLLASSETIAFTVSVYFAATAIKGREQVKDLRWTIRGCLAATLASAVASVIITELIM